MSNELNEELSSLIAKHLPQATGEVLRTRLEQADRDAADLRTSRQLLDAKIKECESYKTRCNKVEQELAAHPKLSEREAALTKREQALELELLRHKVNTQDDVILTLKGVMMGLVRNTEFRQTIHESHNGRQLMHPQGYTVSGPPESADKTVTTSAD